MPIYDCGHPDCPQCQRTFGPDRARAIELYWMREKVYAAMITDKILPTRGTVMVVIDQEHNGYKGLCHAAAAAWAGVNKSDPHVYARTKNELRHKICSQGNPHEVFADAERIICARNTPGIEAPRLDDIEDLA